MLSIEVVGESRLLAALSGLENQVRDQRRGLNAAIDEALIPDLAVQFDTEGRGRWPALSQSYLERKRKVYGDKPILQASGALQKSLTQAGATQQVRDVRADGAEYGTDLQYASIHQTGGRGIKQREIFDITPQLVDRIQDVLREENADGCEGLGFEVIR